MPAAGNSVEAAAIEAAYEARIQTLFLGLATNLGDAPASEQQNVDRFTKGLNTAKRARQLALNAVGAEVRAAVAQTRRKKIDKK
jgi:hypothetical protein